MKSVWIILIAGVVGLSGAGCAKVSSRVVEKPRMDQKLSKGNRGYFQGTPPAAPTRSSTRKFVEVDVEFAAPGELNPWPIKKKKEMEEPSVVPDSTDKAEPASLIFGEDEVLDAFEGSAVQEKMVTVLFPMEPESTTAIVQKGDTLEKIAARVYGDSKLWRSIYEANRDVLKSPNRIYPGQELVIPPAPAKSGQAASGSDFK